MGWLLLASVLSLVVTSVVAAVVLVRLPADFFHRSFPHRRIFLPWRILSNLAGLLLVATGVVLSFPGIPGQGVLTIVLGLLLLDLPGKRRMLRWIVTRRRVRGAIDRLRRRFGKEPLVVD